MEALNTERETLDQGELIPNLPSPRQQDRRLSERPPTTAAYAGMDEVSNTIVALLSTMPSPIAPLSRLGILLLGKAAVVLGLSCLREQLQSVPDSENKRSQPMRITGVQRSRKTDSQSLDICSLQPSSVTYSSTSRLPKLRTARACIVFDLKRR